MAAPSGAIAFAACGSLPNYYVSRGFIGQEKIRHWVRPFVAGVPATTHNKNVSGSARFARSPYMARSVRGGLSGAAVFMTGGHVGALDMGHVGNI